MEKLKTKHRKAKKGKGLTKPGRIEMDCINCGKSENVGPPFFQIYISLYLNVIYTAGESFSFVMWP